MSDKARKRVATVLLVLGCVLLPLGGVAVWVRNLLLDTDRYVETVAPLRTDPAIVHATAVRLTDGLFAAVDVEDRLTELLPSGADAAVPALVSAMHEFVLERAEALIGSDEFAQLWEEANRRAHSQIKHLLTTEGRELPGGRVVLDLRAAATRLALALQAQGVDVFDTPITAGAINLQLFKSDALNSARSAVNLLQKLAFLLPLLAIICLAASIAAHPDRRRGVKHVGIGIASSALVVAIGLAIGRWAYLNAVSDDESVDLDAAKAIFDTVVRFFRSGVRTVALIGILIAMLAWVTGPSARATTLREGLRGRQFGTGTAWGRWIEANASAVRAGIGVATALVFILLDHPGPVAVLVVGGLALAGLAVVEACRPRGEAETPTPTS